MFNESIGFCWFFHSQPQNRFWCRFVKWVKNTLGQNKSNPLSVIRLSALKAWGNKNSDRVDGALGSGRPKWNRMYRNSNFMFKWIITGIQKGRSNEIASNFNLRFLAQLIETVISQCVLDLFPNQSKCKMNVIGFLGDTTGDYILWLFSSVKSYKTKWVILGQELTEYKLSKENSGTTLAAPRGGGLVLPVLHWSIRVTQCAVTPGVGHSDSNHFPQWSGSSWGQIDHTPRLGRCDPLRVFSDEEVCNSLKSARN
jgi:hypothetical protein